MSKERRIVLEITDLRMRLDIARAYGVNRPTVSRIVNDKTHRRVVETDLPKLMSPEERAAKYRNLALHHRRDISR